MAPRAIVVAFDFSGPSRRALEWARLLGARLSAAVTVVHVDAAPPYEAVPSEGRARFLEGELRREIERAFAAEERAVRAHVSAGEPAERLLELALEHDADLVVAGSTGKSEVERALLGSVTDELVRRSPIPVMIVH